MELENNEVDLTDENLNVSLSEEEIQKIESASLEELFEGLESIEDIVEDVEGEEAPVDDLGPAMESLMGMMEEIRHSGGISRSDASTLMDMTTSMEGFQDTFRNLPLASFTEVPSKVNYDASMESVVGSVVKKIIEAIKRAIKWVREKLRSGWAWITRSNVKSKQAEVATKRVVAEVKSVPVPTKEDLEETVKLVTIEDVDAYMLGGSGKMTIGKNGRVATKLDEKAVAEAKKTRSKDVDEVLNLMLTDTAEDLQRRTNLAMIDMMETDLVKRVFEYGDTVANLVTAYINGRGGDPLVFIRGVESAAEKLAGKSLGDPVLTDRHVSPGMDELSTVGSGLVDKVFKATQLRTQAITLQPKDALDLVRDLTTYIVREGDKIHAQRAKVAAALGRALDLLDKDIKKAERTAVAISAEVKTAGDEASEKLALVQRLVNYHKNYLLPIAMRSAQVVEMMPAQVGKMSAAVNHHHGKAK